MKHIFWLIDGELCGRSGPNYQPWRAQELKEAGVGAVLSVNNADSVYADEFDSVGCRIAVFHWRAMHHRGPVTWSFVSSHSPYHMLMPVTKSKQADPCWCTVAMARIAPVFSWLTN